MMSKTLKFMILVNTYLIPFDWYTKRVWLRRTREFNARQPRKHRQHSKYHPKLGRLHG